jgi:hypothetical protein
MSQDPRKPVSVDDLIRVKRGEHPDRGFWSDWQGGMAQRLTEAKQAPRSFWRDALPRFWISVAKWQLPVGASALFILGFVVVHEYHRSLPPLPSTLSYTASAYVQVPSSLDLPAPVSVSEEHREPGLGTPVAREPGELTGMIAMGGRVAEGGRSPVSRLVDPSVANSIGTDWRLQQTQEERTQPVAQPPENILGFSYAASPASSKEQRPASGRFRLPADLRLAEGLLRSADRGDHTSLRF